MLNKVCASCDINGMRLSGFYKEKTTDINYSFSYKGKKLPGKYPFWFARLIYKIVTKNLIK